MKMMYTLITVYYLNNCEIYCICNIAIFFFLENIIAENLNHNYIKFLNDLTYL